MTETDRTPPTALELWELNEKIGRKVRALREGRGWTQQQLADRLRLEVSVGSQPLIAKLEAGGRSPRIDELLAFARIFQRSVDELLGMEPPKPTDPTELARELLAKLEAIRERERFYYI